MFINISNTKIIEYYSLIMFSKIKKAGNLRHFIDKKLFKNGHSVEDYLENNQIKQEWSIELFEGLFNMHSKNIVQGP